MSADTAGQKGLKPYFKVLTDSNAIKEQPAKGLEVVGPRVPVM